MFCPICKAVPPVKMLENVFGSLLPGGTGAIAFVYSGIIFTAKK